MTIQTVDSIVKQALSSIQMGKNTERNIEIAERYFGFDGLGGSSMQEAGNKFSLTRESVRQITNKISQHLEDTFKTPSELVKAVKIINKSLPASATVLEEILCKEGLLSEGYKLEGLLSIADTMGVEVKHDLLIKHNEDRFLVHKKHEKLAQEIESDAISEISHNGAVSIDYLAKKTKINNKEVRVAFAKAVMKSIPESVFAGQAEDWVFFLGKGRNRLLRRIEVIFSLVEKANAVSIKEGISRNWKKNLRKSTAEKEVSKVTQVLDADVILSVLKATGEYKTDGEGMIYAVSPQSPEGIVKEFEKKIFDMINASPSGICREKELEDALVAAPTDKWNFSVALNYCPLIIRVEDTDNSTVSKKEYLRGQYQLVGQAR